MTSTTRPFGLLVLACLMSCFVLAQTVSEDQKVILTNEANINSKNLEYSPTFYEDGILFISTAVSKKRYKVLDRQINQNVMSIFRAKRSEAGMLVDPQPFALELLTPVHEGPVTFDQTGETIFFTRNNYKGGKLKKSKDGKVKLKIYQATLIDSSWQNIQELPFNLNQSNTVHPSATVDGQKLYFASDREGGFGGLDLYVVERQGEGWSEPMNLGETINTELDDHFPFIHADGSLYFTSAGHSGYGGLDLFHTVQDEEGKWSKPKNLEKPFNSEFDDLGFILDRDKKNGYYSSNRSGGRGEDDIYSFYITTNLDDAMGIKPVEEKIVIKEVEVPAKPSSRTINILVIDHSTGEPIIEAKVNYMNLDDLTIAKAITALNNNQDNDGSKNELMLRLSMDESGDFGVTDYDGKYPLKALNSNYILNIEKDGYLPRMVVLTADSDLNEILVSLKQGTAGEEGIAGTDTDTDTNTDTGTIPTEEVSISTTISEGTTFELPSIYYNFNDASIRPDAKVDLDALAAFLNQYPDINVELASHTDARGGNRYNRKLSQRRAENAVKYLMRRGIDRSRLIAVGYGKKNIRNHCMDGIDCTETEHQYNRRTEVRIVKMDQDINIKFVNVAPGTTENTRTTTTTTEEETSYGEFKVVAGVFQELKNAEKRVRRLKESGVDNAEIVSFGGADLYSVVVRRFSDMKEARAYSKELKRDHGFRSFIKE